ncbi:ABC transporter substrate-binding protein [Halopiger xanaduensis]|uniref:ABC-type transporter, periplasmic subunit n=1 Tax=Halopiger xanaduensis (strain DSM 18323 / JCM 14033 / SH-6) TaxID=797210 RepID=F8DCB5_HALXS|nr:ABC transporter substrate-binding protein [Halopiger xanaduensis]AEH38372.1 ABC-type transporter, periplasmic subunit [Halopiger xanaduensis SH-6]
MPADHQSKEYLSRRKMLALTGATGAATLAGCSGGGNGEDPDNVTGNNLEEIEADVPENYEDEMNEVLPASNANPYNGEYIFNEYHQLWNSGDIQESCFEYLAIYNTDMGEYVPRVAEDWTVGEDNLVEVQLSEDYGWHDGSDITAEDFAARIRMDCYMQMGLEQYIDPDEGVRAVDDYTLEIEPRDDYANLEQGLWEAQWAETLLSVSAEQYGDFLEQFEEASSEEEQQTVQEEVIGFEPEWNQVKFSGPLFYAEANEQYGDRVPNQNHPIAKDWDFYQRCGYYTGEAGMQSGDADWIHNDPTLEGLPDKYDSPPVSYSGQSLAIIFGAEDEYIRDNPEVRKAIAYAVDMENVTEVTAPGTPVDEYSGGIDSGYIENFVSEDVLDAMPNYAPQDTDRAAELLEEVGFSRNGDDMWETPDGDTWTLNFPVGDWFEDHSEMVYNNLAEFGIDVDWYVEEMPTWQSDTQNDLAYDLTIHLNYGMAREYHAHSDLYEEMYSTTRGIYETDRDLFGEEVEVPEVGNPEGDTVTINIPEELDALSTADSDEEVQEHASNLAWAHNQLLPGAMVFPWSEHYWVNADEWNFDLETNDWLTSNRITHYLLQNGLSPE